MWYEPIINTKNVQHYRKKLPQTIDCFFNDIFISVWYMLKIEQKLSDNWVLNLKLLILL